MDRDDVRRASRRKAFGSLLVAGGVMIAEVLAVLIVVFLNLPEGSIRSSLIPELAGAASVALGMLALGGAEWVSTSREDVRYTFRFAWWCVAISVALLVLEVVVYLVEGSAISTDWLQNTAELALFCAAVGVFEEFMFRGVLFNALLGLLGTTHRGVVRAVLITSLLFGLAHVDFSVAFVSALTVIQAVLKALQTGMYSVLLCTIALRTRKLGGVSLLHGFDDFLILFPSVALFDEPLSTTYVSTGDDAVPTIIYYLFVIALYVPFVVKSARELQRGQDVYQGVFLEDVVAAVEREEQRRAEAAGAGMASAGEPEGLPARPEGMPRELPLPMEAATAPTSTMEVVETPAPAVSAAPAAPAEAPAPAEPPASVGAPVPAAGERRQGGGTVPTFDLRDVASEVPGGAPSATPPAPADERREDVARFALSDPQSQMPSHRDARPAGTQEPGATRETSRSSGRPPAPDGL